MIEKSQVFNSLLHSTYLIRNVALIILLNYKFL